MLLRAPCAPMSLPALLAGRSGFSGTCLSWGIMLHGCRCSLAMLKASQNRVECVGVLELSCTQLIATQRKKEPQKYIPEYFPFCKLLLFACCYRKNLQRSCCTAWFPTLRVHGERKRKGHVNEWQLSIEVIWLNVSSQNPWSCCQQSAESAILLYCLIRTNCPELSDCQGWWGHNSCREKSTCWLADWGPQLCFLSVL